MFHQYSEDTLWTVDYAYLTDENETHEDRIWVKASSLSDAAHYARVWLEGQSNMNRWTQFTIWDIGIVQDELF